MAVKAVCGFEDSTIADLVGTRNSTSFATYSTAQRHQTISGYGGLQSLKFTDNSNWKVTGKSAGAAADKLHVATYVANPTMQSNAYVAFHDSANLGQFTVAFATDGVVRLQRGSQALGGQTTIATSVGTWLRDTWNTWKIQVTLREAASSGRAQVWLNGDTTAIVDTGAGVDCRNTSTDDFLHVLLGTSNSATGIYYDDFYWVATGDTLPDEALYIVALRPDGEGGTVQSTSSTGGARNTTVDEGNPMSTSDYNELGTAGFEDHLTMGDLSASPSSVLCVAAFCYATGEGTITQARTLVESNGSTTYGTNQTLPSGGTYGVVFDFYLTDPSGGGAWTVARVNGLLAGYECN